jgi:sugar phosphate isomerase/epimerase
MLLGYNTNGFAHHRLEDAIEILADLGYRSVAITLDFHALNPFDPASLLKLQIDRVAALLRRYEMRCVIETGARFLLDRWRKHQPTLLDPDKHARDKRLNFLRMACVVAEALQADAVSFWSGMVPPGEPEEVLWERLVEGCQRLCEEADTEHLRLAFEPEPGMFIDTMARFARLFTRVNHPRFGLTLDVGHVYCTRETPIAPHAQRWRDVLWNVHIEDIRLGLHEHLRFGEGNVDFDEVFCALKEVGYTGGVHAELSRHSHDAVWTARSSVAFLRRYLP